MIMNIFIANGYTNIFISILIQWISANQHQWLRRVIGVFTAPSTHKKTLPTQKNSTHQKNLLHTKNLIIL